MRIAFLTFALLSGIGIAAGNADHWATRLLAADLIAQAGRLLGLAG